jgi:hypothetical protein
MIYDVVDFIAGEVAGQPELSLDRESLNPGEGKDDFHCTLPLH